MSEAKKETILVVEDDEAVAALEKRHLERAGYTVEVLGSCAVQ